MGILGGSSKRDRRRARSILYDAAKQSQLATGQAVGLQTEANRETAKGFDTATRLASDSARSVRREAKENAGKLEGEVMQRFGATGKYGTTAMDQARAGIGSRLTRDMDSINTRLSGLMGGLAVGKSQAVAQGKQQLGARIGSGAALNAGIAESRASSISAMKDPGALGGLFGMLAGMVNPIAGGGTWNVGGTQSSGGSGGGEGILSGLLGGGGGGEGGGGGGEGGGAGFAGSLLTFI